MAERISPEQRSLIMSRIKGSDTGIEVQVRRYLFSHGFRYRKNDKRYPGKPDIVMPKYKTVIFVNGCFWHQHAYCKYSTVPKTRTEYWENKFRTNKENDIKHYSELESMGWNVIVIWECELKKDMFETTMQRVENELFQCRMQSAEC